MSVFNYNDYKVFFRDLIRQKGSAGWGEFRKIAELLNVHPSLVSQVLSRDKDFTSEQIIRIAKHYGLGKNECRYLVLLVEIERAGSKDLREHFIEMKNELQKKSLQLSERLDTAKTLTDQQKAIFYSSWAYSAIHLATSLDQKIDFDFICKKLNLTPERVTEILEFLKDSKLVLNENGGLKPGVSQTHIEKNSPFIMKHHANWQIKALEKSENLTDQELMYSVSVSLSLQDFEKLREEMVVFIQKFLKTVHASPAEDWPISI